MCYKPIVFPNNKIIATVTHVGCTAHMLIPLPHFTRYCSKCTELHYVSLSVWQTVSFNFGIRSWNVTLTLFFSLFSQGVKSFQEVGHITLSDIKYTIRCYRTLFISGHIITQQYLNCGAEMYDSLSQLTGLTFLSCHRYRPHSGERKQNIYVFYSRNSSALQMHLFLATLVQKPRIVK